MGASRSMVLATAAVMACAPAGEEKAGGAGDASVARRGRAPTRAGTPGKAAAAARAASAAARSRTVTLLTGDRVTVVADRQVMIDPAASRRGVVFRTERVRGHLLVIPSDAAALLAAGVIDRRLFDVTGLVALDYDDAHRDDLPLLVTRDAARGRRSATASAALLAAGARVSRPLPSIGGEAVSVPKRDATALWSALVGGGAVPRSLAGAAGGSGVRVWLDGKRDLVLDHSVPRIGAPAAWTAGYTGAGVVVAVLDTGIDADHPDFAGRIDEERDFLFGGVEGAPDEVGHGTHVASILAGSGAADGGLHRGVAPDAHLLIGRVCELGGCPESAILAGMEWAAASGAAVVNLSLAGPDDPGTDPLERAIDELTAQHGTLFVAAAGNLFGCGGENGLQVSSPGTADAALSVGAVSADDALAFFSCRGPRAGDAAVKPDLTAPGVGIVAARAVGTPVGDDDPVGDFHARLSGTSMATPHVAGAAALLAQQHPDWAAAELKAALMASARPTRGISAHEQGAGRVDVARALTQIVLGSPSSLVFGLAPWPHDDDEPILRALTYRNTGDQPIELAISVEARGPDGAPAPAGLFTVEPDTVTVPAGGEVQVAVAANTAVEGPDGVFAGVVVAASGEQTVRTTVAVDRQVEAHDTTIRVLDRDGSPTAASLSIVDLATGLAQFPFTDTGELTVRLPRGSYLLDMATFVPDTRGHDAIFMLRPLLVVDKPTETVFAAADAAALDLRVPDRAVRPMAHFVDYLRALPGGGEYGMYVMMPPVLEDRTPQMFLGHVGPEVGDQLATFIGTGLAVPGAHEPDSFHGSPSAYHLFYTAPPGRFPTGFSRDVQADELTAVESDTHAVTPGRSVTLPSGGVPPHLTASFVQQGVGVAYDTPARRTEYYVTDGVLWSTLLWEVDAGQVHLEQSVFARRVEERTRETWNDGVLGPIVAYQGPLFFGSPPFLRLDGSLYVEPLLFGDGSRHAGDALVDGHMRLFASGQLLDEVPRLFAAFPVAPEATEYRLEVEAKRVAPADRSTRVTAAWTFRSSAEDEGQPLSVLGLRFYPRLDREHTAPGGGVFVLPFEIERQVGTPGAAIRHVEIEASYDRGERWHRAILLRYGDRGFAFLFHPATGSVSLRARAVDEVDRAFDQTIVDAYRLR